MLAGARAVDAHFRDTDGRANLPLRAAFADRFYAGFRGCQTRAVFAYDERLALFPSYLQQLEMESNGKRVTADGQPGGPTDRADHLGRGGDRRAARGVPAAPPGHRRGPGRLHRQHRAGRRARSRAPPHPADQLLRARRRADGGRQQAADGSDPARAFPGDRPSATILCDDIDAATLGALIAFHEHRTFANAVLMGINPFDQFGVELGKKMANDIAGGDGKFDASTAALLGAAGLA